MAVLNSLPRGYNCISILNKAEGYDIMADITSSPALQAPGLMRHLSHFRHSPDVFFSLYFYPGCIELIIVFWLDSVLTKNHERLR